jgi:site-specific DNA recombinase
LSIDAQIRELKEFAQKSNLYIVDILIESKSAHKPGREVFNNLLYRIQMGEANAILVWQINRLARNALDGGTVIWSMDQGKIKQIDTPHKQFKNNGDDKFFMTLEFGMAKKYSDDLSDSIRRGNREKYQRGEYSGWAPIGYLNAKINGHPNIIIDAVKAPIVQKVFQEYATGMYSLGMLCDLIKKWGLVTQKGKPIGKSHLQKLLTNSTYYGWYKHGGELHKGNYESLISKELFDRVDDVLHDRSKPKKISNEWAYAGLIKCGCECGATIIFETKKKYYKGTDRSAEYTYARSSKRCGVCYQQGTSLSRLEDQIIEKLEQVRIDEETWKLGKELLYAKYEKEANDRKAILMNRQKEYHLLQDELNGYFKMRAKEEMSSEEFQQKKSYILQKQEKVQEQIDNGVHNQRFWLELADDFFDTACQAKKMIESDVLEEKRKAVKKVGWNLKLKDEELVWTYQPPYDVLLIPEYRTNVSRGKDSNLRRENPADLQSAPVGHLGTSGCNFL